MNIALPALVILLGLLPGIACFYGYFNGRFDKRSAGVSGVEELAFLNVVFSIPINAISLYLSMLAGVDFDFDVAARMLSGLSTDNAPIVAAALRKQAALSARTYLAILAGSFILGSIARRLVWALRLDTKVSIFDCGTTGSTCFRDA